MVDENQSDEHLLWLIQSRGANNLAALELIKIAKKHRQKLENSNCGAYFQMLVACAFSLWRAAFLAETSGETHLGIRDAEAFLRKMLSDNNIAFSHDMQWREWSVNYYLSNARYHLHALSEYWPEAKGLYSLEDKSKASSISKRRWHVCSEMLQTFVEKLSETLEAEDDASVQIKGRRKKK